MSLELAIRCEESLAGLKWRDMDSETSTWNEGCLPRFIICSLVSTVSSTSIRFLFKKS